jgi:hypothetical protein
MSKVQDDPQYSGKTPGQIKRARHHAIVLRRRAAKRGAINGKDVHLLGQIPGGGNDH